MRLIPSTLCLLACSTPKPTPIPAAVEAAIEAPTASPPLEHHAMLWYAGGILVPLACWDDEQQAVVFEEACEELVPAGGTFSLLDGGSVVGGPRATWHCDANASKATGVQAQVDRLDEHTPVAALWSSAGAPRATLTVHEAPDEAPAEVLAAAHAREPDSVGVPAHVQQVARADLDGDGALDTLYDLVISEALDDELVEGVYGGFVVRWGATGTVTAEESDTFTKERRILAVSDLDEDGRAELLVYHREYDGISLSLLRWEGQVLERVHDEYCGG